MRSFENKDGEGRDGEGMGMGRGCGEDVERWERGDEDKQRTWRSVILLVASQRCQTEEEECCSKRMYREDH